MSQSSLSDFLSGPSQSQERFSLTSEQRKALYEHAQAMWSRSREFSHFLNGRAVYATDSKKGKFWEDLAQALSPNGQAIAFSQASRCTAPQKAAPTRKTEDASPLQDASLRKELALRVLEASLWASTLLLEGRDTDAMTGPQSGFKGSTGQRSTYSEKLMQKLSDLEEKD